MPPEPRSGDRWLPRLPTVIALGAIAGAIVWASMTLLAGSSAPPTVAPIQIDTTPAVREAERMERRRRAERRERLEQRRRRAEQRRRAAERRREATPAPAPEPAPAPAPEPAPAPAPAPFPPPVTDDDDGGDD